MFMNNNLIIPRGSIMIGVSGYSLSVDDIRRLKNPNIGGVILFSRNFESKAQLNDLVKEIKNLRFPELIVAVDHEGGRVQRFREGFTQIPAMGILGDIAINKSVNEAKDLTKKVGFVLACELRSVGIDFSFTPVIDLNFNRNKVIGDRSFGRDVNVVIELAKSLLDGLRLSNMASCCKHFPGHGFVVEDSHLDLPIDNRPLSELEANDLLPFEALIEYGVDGIMPAHIIYEQVDTFPTGFSEKWLKYLRYKLDFKGVIFSDDLNMQGANKFAPNINNKVQLALNAGCDIVLICNDFQEIDTLLDNNKVYNNADYAWYKFRGMYNIKKYSSLVNTKEFKILQEEVSALNK